MTPVQERLVQNYATLVMAKVKTLKEVPKELQEYVKIEIAKREIEIIQN